MCQLTIILLAVLFFIDEEIEAEKYANLLY